MSVHPSIINNTAIRSHIINNGFIITLKGGETTVLKKGMKRSEVIKLLGEPSLNKPCRSPHNEKLVFKAGSSNLEHHSYLVFFIRQQLEYVIKST